MPKKVFNVKIIESTKNLLKKILEKNSKWSLKNTKQLFKEIYGKRFADEIDKNGILRYNSLRDSDENIQYWGVLYKNAPQSGVYQNFSLVVFPDNTKNPEQLLVSYGVGTGGDHG